jgi:hypothetical protein
MISTGSPGFRSANDFSSEPIDARADPTVRVASWLAATSAGQTSAAPIILCVLPIRLAGRNVDRSACLVGRYEPPRQHEAIVERERVPSGWSPACSRICSRICATAAVGVGAAQRGDNCAFSSSAHPVTMVINGCMPPSGTSPRMTRKRVPSGLTSKARSLPSFTRSDTSKRGAGVL